MRKTRSRKKQSREHVSAVGESFPEGCRVKYKTETDATCETEGRFRTLAENETSINTLEDLNLLDELFDAAAFSVEGNGMPGALIDNPSAVVQPLERPANGHEGAKNQSTMQPLKPSMDFSNDTYIATSALREEILVAYKHNNDLRLAVKEQDPE
jgi:hypothetical protein